MPPIFMVTSKLKALCKSPVNDMFFVTIFDDRTEEEIEKVKMERYNVKKA